MPVSTSARAGPNAGLQIRLFGPLDITLSGRVVPHFPTRRSKLLFAYLTLHRGHMQSRDRVAGTLWGERPEAVARTRLRTALWRVRATLGKSASLQESEEYVSAGRDEVGFTPTVSYWLDVEEFENRASAAKGPFQACAPTIAAGLREAVELYRGDLLEGEYDSWLIEEQDRLRGMFLEALERLVIHHVSRGEWVAAAEYTKRLLATDPMREHAHRELMVLYYLQGDRGRAIKQYFECRKALDDELGVEPMRRTRDLYDALLDEDEERLNQALGEAGGMLNPSGGPGSARPDPLETLLRRR
ncbi:MAG: BTAD domain-containing putative transcriptional regulator [Gemmatimonadota bacterium]